ncbi:MAG: hypothetical protein WCB27_18525 [Thermoguttaceae bacterium]
MTHGGLCRSRCNARSAQKRAEGVSHGVNVYGPAAFVPFVDSHPAVGTFHPPSDPRGHKVTVENPH